MPAYTGGKWGASSAFGTPGGAVTWSIVDGGVGGVFSAFGYYRSNYTSDADDFRGYDVETIFNQAFSYWSDVADIDFIRVADGGERLGEGTTADIRLAFGGIDGFFGGGLGHGFFPSDDPTGGDILFDEDEDFYYSSPEHFRAVVIHEIGHAIGLDHVTGVPALMNPILGNIWTPVADDIAGIRTIYGSQDGALAPLLLADRSNPDITILEYYDGLTVRGDARANEIWGHEGNERLLGGKGDDFLVGSGGNDIIVGARDADWLSGGSGADVLRGGKHNDYLFGGDGNDMMRGAAGDDYLSGGFGHDTMAGGTGSDLMYGGFAGDVLVGKSGDDELRGQRGMDDLRGGSGADTLVGGRGNDTLAGGEGADVFLFAASAGRDVITDFELGADMLDYSVNTRVSDLSDLTLTDLGGGVLITDGTGGTLMVLGVDQNDMTASDFLF